MKRLLFLFLLLFNFVSKAQNIDSYKTDDFREKPKNLILFVAVGDDVDENRRVATNIVKLLPKEITVLKVLNYNKAWTKSPEETILHEGLKVGAIAVLKIVATDTKQINNLTPVNVLLYPGSRETTQYKCSLEYVQTQTVLWNAVSKYLVEGCPYNKFIKQAIKDGVL